MNPWIIGAIGAMFVCCAFVAYLYAIAPELPWHD